MKQRWEILAELINKNNYTRIAEVGVSRGINASEVLKRCPQIEKFYLIDIDFTPLDMGLFFGFHNKRDFRHAVETDTITEKVDLVFIDGNHAYDAVWTDIKTWLPKVRKGGIICGHDYVAQEGYGVKKAVDELLPNRNLEDDVLENGKVKVWWIYV